MFITNNTNEYIFKTRKRLRSKLFPVKIYHKNQQKNMECIKLCSENLICKAA